MRTTPRIQCACGGLQLEVEGAPIVTAECHCESCRTAGARLRTLPGAPPFLEPNGGTRFVLYRKDRVRFVAGAAVPRAELRTMMSDLPPGTTLSDDVPGYATQSPSFMLKLLGAWIGMGFRSPSIAVDGELQL